MSDKSFFSWEITSYQPTVQSMEQAELAGGLQVKLPAPYVTFYCTQLQPWQLFELKSSFKCSMLCAFPYSLILN